MSALVSTLRSLVAMIFGGYVKLGRPFGQDAYGIVIPTDASKVGNDVSQDYLDSVKTLYLARMAEIFGGFTAMQSLGGWINHEGTLITEDVLFVLAYAESPTLEQLSQLESLARRVKYELYQDCVTVIASGAAYLVDKDHI